MNQNTEKTGKGLSYRPKPVVVATGDSIYAAREVEPGLLTGGNPAIDASEDDEPFWDNIVAGLYASGLLVSH